MSGIKRLALAVLQKKASKDSNKQFCEEYDKQAGKKKSQKAQAYR